MAEKKAQLTRKTHFAVHVPLSRSRANVIPNTVHPESMLESLAATFDYVVSELKCSEQVAFRQRERVEERDAHLELDA